MDDKTIKTSHSARFLGIILDDKLTWNKHVNDLVMKIKRNLSLLRLGQNVMTKDCKKLLYYAQIYSYLNYGIAVWGSMLTAQQLIKLQKLQDKAVKLITNNKDLNLKSERLLNIKQLIKLENCKMGYKLTHHELPSKLAESFYLDQNKKLLAKNHRYPTRKKNILNLAKSDCMKYKASFLQASIREYHALPVVTSQSPNLSIFIKNLKAFMFK